MKRQRYAALPILIVILGLLLLIGSPVSAQPHLSTAFSELFGDGADGAFGGGDPNTVRTALSGQANAGQSTIAVADSSGFTVGKEILIIQVQGPNAGGYEFGTIASKGAGLLTLSQNLSRTYVQDGTSRAQVLWVPHFSTVSGSISTGEWNGNVGGMVVFRALNIASATVDVSVRGFKGGYGDDSAVHEGQICFPIPPERPRGQQGTSPVGYGGCSNASNGGGGGGGYEGPGDPHFGAGGGGGYGSAGANGIGPFVGSGGTLYGVADLSLIYLGSGGGGGSWGTNPYGGGRRSIQGTDFSGQGAGAMLVFGQTISNLSLFANGNAGGNSSGSFGGYGGGGGSGGSIKLVGGNITATNASAIGGSGGAGTRGNGGTGGVGRIRIEYCDAFSGATNPPASVQQLNCNAAPVAASDSYTTNEDTLLTVPAPGVLANDSDADGDSLTAVVVANPSHGALTLNSDGSFTYIPALNYNGADSFSYTANDGTTNSNVITVSITTNAVNDTPMANDQTATTNEDTPTTITLTATDVDGDALTYSIVNGPAQGSLSGTAPNLTYTPNANYNGSDSFSFKANDGQTDSNVATVTITISAINDGSLAADDSYTTNEDITLAIASPGVLANDMDVDEDSLIAVLMSGPTHGALTLNSDGSFTYIPDSDYNGLDSFSYKARDTDTTLSNEATVNIVVTAVNDAPSFMKGADQTVLEDAGSQIVSRWATTIGPGPSDETDQALDFLVVNDNTALFSAQPSITPDGTLTYTPAPNANGDATVIVRLHDDGGTDNGGVDTSSVQTFTISVMPVNDAPSFTSGSNVSVLEDSGAYSAGWATATSAGSPEESDQALTFEITTNSNPGLFSVGPTIASNGTLNFTPAPDANGSTIITIVLRDNGGTANGGLDTSPSQSFTITVAAVNDRPGFTRGADQTLLEDAGPQMVSNWASDISAGPNDELGQSLSFLVTGNTNSALFSAGPVIVPDGTLSFTPAPNANGSADITVVLKDDGGTENGGQDTSTPVIFTITVTPVNDPSTIVVGAGGQCASPNTPTGTINIMVGDLDSAASSLTLTGSSSNQALVPDGNITFGGSGASRTATIAALINSGTAVVTIMVSDGQTTAQMIVTVKEGTSGNNTLNGTTGTDIIFGQGGNDTLNGLGGNDLLCGGSGEDTLSGGNDNDTIDAGNGNDMISGNDGDDTLLGNSGDDMINGGSGNDVLDGGSGNDTLDGGSGDDTLTGGASADFFSGRDGTDTATDFKPSEGDTQDGTIP